MYAHISELYVSSEGEAFTFKFVDELSRAFLF